MQKFIALHLFFTFAALMFVDNATGQGAQSKASSTSTKSTVDHGVHLFSPVKSSTTEDVWAMLATLTSPKPTTTKKPESDMNLWIKSLYTKYGITPTTRPQPRFITGPWFDDEHPLPTSTTTSAPTPAPKPSNTTQSYLSYVLDKWLKDGHESRHSYTDVHAGLPLSPTDIPDYQTDFRQV